MKPPCLSPGRGEPEFLFPLLRKRDKVRANAELHITIQQRLSLDCYFSG